MDIGGGAGMLSFYSSIMGAKSTICLEPVLAGSTSGIQEKFIRIKDKLKINNVEFADSTFQKFNTQIKFDIIIMHNSINHLDELACIKLKHDRRSRDIYIGFFHKLNALLADKGFLLICDCSRNNFYNDIGVKNHLMPTIEWKKHQSPRFWAKMAEDSGFKIVRLKWTSFNCLGQIGRILFGNSFANYFLQSHFCLLLAK